MKCIPRCHYWNCVWTNISREPYRMLLFWDDETVQWCNRRRSERVRDFERQATTTKTGQRREWICRTIRNSHSDFISWPPHLGRVARENLLLFIPPVQFIRFIVFGGSAPHSVTDWLVNSSVLLMSSRAEICEIFASIVCWPVTVERAVN